MADKKEIDYGLMFVICWIVGNAFLMIMIAGLMFFPPEVVHKIQAVILLMVFGGQVWFLRRFYKETSEESPWLDLRMMDKLKGSKKS